MDKYNDKMSSIMNTNDSQICVICMKRPDNILVTIGDHNLCLECAAQKYKERTNFDKNVNIKRSYFVSFVML